MSGKNAGALTDTRRSLEEVRGELERLEVLSSPERSPTLMDYR